MIEDLSFERLREIGFPSDQIEDFKTDDQYEAFLIKGQGNAFWASNKIKKIYSGIDGARRCYFRANHTAFPRSELSLIPEYFELRLRSYLKERAALAGGAFVESQARERFKQQEIEVAQNAIKKAEEDFARAKYHAVINQIRNEKIAAETYLDWLREHKFAELEKPSAIIFLQPIPEHVYLNVYAQHAETMQFFENNLKAVNEKLTLGTSLNDLPAIYSQFKRWEEILKWRQQYAPSKELAASEFRKELLSKIEYDDEAGINDPKNQERYFNQYRKIAYQFRCKGQLVTLQGLGHILLKHKCNYIEGKEPIVGIAVKPDLEGVIEAFADGSALAEYLHKENSSIEIERQNNKSIDTLNKSLKKKVQSFEDVFKISDWEKFVNALCKTDPPLLSAEWEFIGNRKKHIGVICSWFNHLKTKGIIAQNISRSDLAAVLNFSLKNFNMGKDGKTFDNISNEYRKFENYLIHITK